MKIFSRIDEKGKDILQRYCEQKKVNQMEAVRNAIYKLEDDIQDGTNTNMISWQKDKIVIQCITK